ncbi:hypothetical protein B0H11DRAFT_1974662, partial [Mycena galericulata]
MTVGLSSLLTLILLPTSSRSFDWDCIHDSVPPGTVRAVHHQGLCDSGFLMCTFYVKISTKHFSCPSSPGFWPLPIRAVFAILHD